MLMLSTSSLVLKNTTGAYKVCGLMLGIVSKTRLYSNPTRVVRPNDICDCGPSFSSPSSQGLSGKHSLTAQMCTFASHTVEMLPKASDWAT